MKCYLAQQHKIKNCQECYAKESCEIYKEHQTLWELEDRINQERDME